MLRTVYRITMILPLVACGSETTTPQDTGPTTINAGAVSGSWSGIVNVQGDVMVETGQTLDIAAGTTINFAAETGMLVQGTLRIAGTTASRVMFDATEGQWKGLDIQGGLEMAGVQMSNATLCINGQAASSISIDETVLMGCEQSMTLANGGTMRNMTIIGGMTVTNTGGIFDMADSLIDLRHPTLSPDCTSFDGGGVQIDHIRSTGCHCPIHIERADGEISITNSIFDDATYPVMMANVSGVITGNHLLGSDESYYDLGGNIDVDISDNYYGGDGATMLSDNTDQFRNNDQFSSTPIDGVGPR